MSESPKLTDLERARIVVEAMIPVVRAFEKELGVERAHEIVARARAGAIGAAITKATGGRRFEKMPINAAGVEATAAAGGALEFEVLREDDQAFDFNVTRCRYKQMMEELDAVDLGALLLCNGDFPMADALGLELQRTQTCMAGASHCDFRYRVRR